MSFSVPYSSGYKWFRPSKSTPFDDWKARGSISEAAFCYNALGNYTDATYYFMPGHKFGHIKFNSRGSICWSFKLWFEMSYDEDRKIVHVERLFCERRNSSRAALAFTKKVCKMKSHWIALWATFSDPGGQQHRFR